MFRLHVCPLLNLHAQTCAFRLISISGVREKLGARLDITPVVFALTLIIAFRSLPWRAGIAWLHRASVMLGFTKGVQPNLPGYQDTRRVVPGFGMSELLERYS